MPEKTDSMLAELWNSLPMQQAKKLSSCFDMNVGLGLFCIEYFDLIGLPLTFRKGVSLQLLYESIHKKHCQSG